MKKNRKSNTPFCRWLDTHWKNLKKFPNMPIFKEDMDTFQPLPDTKLVETNLLKVSYFTRGFGRRHYIRLCQYMSEIGVDRLFFSHVRLSFCKFKFLQMIFPDQKKDLIWIFKNLLTLKGQKLYNEAFDTSLEIEDPRWYLNSICENDMEREANSRLDIYFSKREPSEWLPLTAFPSILFKKERMNLAFEKLNDIDLKKGRELFFKYIISLDLKELFIPPADILYKVGNQLYNDDGIVRQDWEKPSTFNSGFKYQYFLAQPLSPREVWLPDKNTKHNNLFWMTIGRQFLKKSPVYPSPDPVEVWNRIKSRLTSHILRFDISGFGFQYPRELLSCMASVIQELYPCDQMDTMASEFYTILDNVKVEKGLEVLFPPRGIGLGYYEDLKTLCMLAILDEYDPISVYGDQGLVPYHNDVIASLCNYNFILDYRSKIEFQSNDDGRLKWAGSQMSSTQIRRAKDLTQPLLGNFFSQFHWERKANLHSFFEDNKIFYRYKYKIFKKGYEMFFGNEFYSDDLSLSFVEGGINPYASILVGESKSFIISRYLRPYEDTLFEAPHVSPFHIKKKKSYPITVSRQFQKERVLAYKKFKPINSDVFFYSEPRIIYNRQYIPHDRLIPDWADLLFVFQYGLTVGNFTYGLDINNIKDIAYHYYLSKDPLRAAARGGYKILDPIYSRARPLGSEWCLALDLLKDSDHRKLPFLPRVDIGVPPPEFGTDKMYFNDNLYRDTMMKFSSKRKRSEAFFKAHS